MLDSDPELEPLRPEARRFVALLVITAAVALALGMLLRQPSMMGANDISRWCTVWSLLERGSFVIDECPWLVDTQDKVYRVSKWENPGSQPVKHYYSSKPALLSTLIAGLLYPARGSREFRSTGSCFKSTKSGGYKRWTRAPRQVERCPGETERPGEVVGLRLLFQGSSVTSEHPAVLDVLDALLQSPRPIRGQRLGLVLQPGRRGHGNLLASVHADTEQPYGGGLQRVLRPLPFLANLG